MFVLNRITTPRTSLMPTFYSVVDPGFPIGGDMDPVGGGHGPPRRLHFENFECQNERIGPLGGGGVRQASANVDPPILLYFFKFYVVDSSVC